MPHLLRCIHHHLPLVSIGFCLVLTLQAHNDLSGHAPGETMLGLSLLLAASAAAGGLSRFRPRTPWWLLLTLSVLSAGALLLPQHSERVLAVIIDFAGLDWGLRIFLSTLLLPSAFLVFALAQLHLMKMSPDLDRPCHPSIELILAFTGLAAAVVLPSFSLLLLILPSLIAGMADRDLKRTVVACSRALPGSLPGFLPSAALAFSFGTTWNLLRAHLDPSPWAFTLSMLMISGLVGVLRLIPLHVPVFIAVGLSAGALLVAVPVPGLVLQLASSELPVFAGLPQARFILPALLLLGLLLPSLPGAVALIGSRSRWSVPMLLSGAAPALWLSVQPGERSHWFLLTTACLLSLSLVLSTRASMAQRSSGLGLLACGLLLGWKVSPPEPSRLALGWASRLRDGPTFQRSEDLHARSEYLAAGVGPQGSYALRTLDRQLVADVEGLPIERSGRLATATRFAAELSFLLPRQAQEFLVIGDDLGLATSELRRRGPASVLVSVAQPPLLRALANHDDNLSKTLLHPSIQLRSIPGPLLLLHSEPVDGIVHLARQAWPDASGQPPSSAFFSLCRARLRPGGVYVGLLSLERSSENTLARSISSFLASFPQGAGWLPPEGTDSLILVGSLEPGPLPLARMQERALLGTPPQRSEDAGSSQTALSVQENALDAAGLALFDSVGLSSLTSPSLLSLPSLPSEITGPPRPILARAYEHFADPSSLFDTDGIANARAELLARQGRHRHLLQMVESSAANDLSSLLKEASSLSKSVQGQKSLDALVEPHLVIARDALHRALKEGLMSPAWGEAENALNVALLVHPESSKTILLLCELRELRGDVVSAESGYQRVLESDPASLDALFGLARVRDRRGNRVGAEQALREAARLHPRQWEAWQNLGILYLQEGRLDQAEDALKRASGLADAATAAPNAGLAEVYLAQGRRSAALIEADRAVRLAPTAFHLFLRGRANFELQQKDRAEQDFQKAVLADPDFFLARGALGQIFAERGDLLQARDAFQAVLAKDPSNVAARLNLRTIESIFEGDKARPFKVSQDEILGTPAESSLAPEPAP